MGTSWGCKSACAAFNTDEFLLESALVKDVARWSSDYVIYFGMTCMWKASDYVTWVVFWEAFVSRKPLDYIYVLNCCKVEDCECEISK